MEPDTEEFKTPIAVPWQERPDLVPPQFVFPVSSSSPGGQFKSPGSAQRAQTIPMAASIYTPTNPSASSPRAHTPQSTVSAHPVLERGPGGTPRSAPAHTSAFGTGADGKEDGWEETLKGRNRRTLPAKVPSSASNLAGLLDGRIDEPGAEQHTVPSQAPISSSPTSIFPSDSPSISPSISRSIFPSDSPPRTQHQLPTITHTPHSPVSSPPSSNTPARPDRSPSRGATPTPTYSSSASITELTDMLGGAIDEIGLIDSRDTPPPMVGEPSKRERPDMRIELEKAKGLEPAAEVVNKGPMTPTSLPTRGTSLSSTTATQTQGATEMSAGVASSLPLHQPELERTTSSILSATSSNNPPPFSSPHITLTHSPTTLSFQTAARPWPSAMSISTLKSHKSAGARALAYARAINEIARAETGLKAWCAAAAAEAHRRPIHATASKTSTSHPAPPVSSPSPSSSSPFDLSPHPRNVSTGSEFPMRADSYTAREISQRVIDPADQPTALPPNLPYPQLQAQVNYHHHQLSPGGSSLGGGLKPSQSMQSVSSFTSSKKSGGGGGGGGFFSAIRKGSSRKESMSMSLGPPGGYMGGSSASKKDVRGLPISAPRSASPQKPDGQLGSGSGSHTPRVQSGIPSPMGPRPLGPRGAGARGSFTPPPPPPPPPPGGQTGRPGRASLDTGPSRMSVPAPAPASSSSSSRNLRGSMDSVRLGMDSGEDVKYMTDVLPYVEKSVLRAYLKRYGGDQMQALGAYLEDEKNGVVR
ncbi:hypothetical protein AYX15_04765 [Cryptococcus neoformans]|nr:hypothetical protein AYX15_04765 [Cryptococcus neoformans var. grubii]